MTGSEDMQLDIRLRPHGRSGLKFSRLHFGPVAEWSPPPRAEWVEITTLSIRLPSALVSAPTGGVG